MALVTAQPALLNLGDDLDDVAPDVNDDLEELFRPMQASINTTQTEAAGAAVAGGSRTNGSKRSRPEDDLGLNDEIQISKKRKPIAKLDDERLLSQAGIPKLRKIAHSRFKFKGKGHEFSDISRLLNHYQLWLDDLYPRAKFADGLALIEKLGHSKRMNVMRREWIKETNTSTRTTTDSTSNSDARPTGTATGTAVVASASRQADDDDEEESLFVGGGGGAEQDDIQDAGKEAQEDQPDDDELDALLAEMPRLPSQSIAPLEEARQPDDDRESHEHEEAQEPNNAFDDRYAEEMQMMAEMEAW